VIGSQRWEVDVDGTRHEVVVDHGYFSARRTIMVDGVPVVDIRPSLFNAVRFWNTATEHAFRVDSHDAVVRIDPTIDNMTYKKFLFIDGRDVAGGASHTPLPGQRGAVREGTWLAGYGGLLVQPFALAALIISQVSFARQGGALGFAAGFAGAGACWAIGQRFAGNARAQVVGCSLVIAAVVLLGRVI
jgi:hypothetical protein